MPLLAHQTASGRNMIRTATHRYMCGQHVQDDESKLYPTVKGWVHDPEFFGQSEFSFYLLALHGVNPKLAPIGDGVATGKTDAELIYSIFAELMSVVVFGVLTGMMSTWIAQGNMSSQAYKSKMDSLSEFLRQKRFPPETRKRVRHFYQHLYSNKTVFNEDAIVNNLPPDMGHDLIEHMYASVIKGTPFLRKLQDEHREVITKLCLSMQPYPAMPGDVIMFEGSCATRLLRTKSACILSR